ncbi:MAG: GSCFA domain-containing protein [Bacteroidetes bacterium]|nr:GSCFA domain-containing protein [Bacteroidota bacterium]
MKFRTEVTPKILSNKISHHHSMMHIGSCFSEHIGNKFKDLGMTTIVNPMGQVYNPLSLCDSLENIISLYTYTEKDLVLYNDIYHTWDHHSDFSNADPIKTLDYINQSTTAANKLLKEANYLFITPATAHYFELKESGQIVSNCHKHPSKEFDLKMATTDEIYNRFKSTL